MKELSHCTSHATYDFISIWISCKADITLRNLLVQWNLVTTNNPTKQGLLVPYREGAEDAKFRKEFTMY